MRKTLTNPDNVQIVVASIDDPDSMKSMTSQTTVIVATAGPFDIIGMPVLSWLTFVASLIVADTSHQLFICRSSMLAFLLELLTLILLEKQHLCVRSSISTTMLLLRKRFRFVSRQLL